MVSEYFTVDGEFENTTIIERSKFICNIKNISNEEEAKEFIELIKKRHSLANHSCYAYIADENGLIMKFSDAGEPQGTAGLPMLDVLKNKKIYKTVAVVTRYFGGIKLGTGGLTRAYGGAVSECLNCSKLIKKIYSKKIEVFCDYDNYNIVLKMLNHENVSVISTDFDNKITIVLAVKDDELNFYGNFIKNLQDIFRTKDFYKEIENNFFSFSICQK